MIAKITKLLTERNQGHHVWLIIYCPNQWQFTITRSDIEGKINSRLIDEGKIEQCHAGFLVGYAPTEAGAILELEEIAKKIKVKWVEEAMRWMPNDQGETQRDGNHE